MVNNTQYLTGGKSPNPLSPPTNLASKAGNAQVTLTWTDPPNATVEPSGQTYATWAYTQVVRKEGSQPTGPHDGIVVVQSSVRDQYATSGFVDTGLTNDTLYYYGAFAYNSDKVVSEGAFVSATPVAGTPLSELTEGTLITINENGAPIEFYVAKQGYEPTLNGPNRVLMVRKDIYDLRAWNSTNKNNFENSEVLNFLNNSYLQMFSQEVISMIDSTKFIGTVGYTLWGVDTSLITLNKPVFWLSYTELGFSERTNVNVEGTALPIASSLVYANYNGLVTPQWTRSPYYNNTTQAMLVNGPSIFAGQIEPCSDEDGNRPVFTLPSTALVDSNLALIETA